MLHHPISLFGWNPPSVCPQTITSPIFLLPQTQGGFSLPDPKAFLYQQHPVMFTHFIRDESSLPRLFVSDFQSFCQVHGITFQGHSLQTIQMDSNVVWRQMPYLAWSMRAFSILRQNLPLPPPTMLAYDTPLCHHVAFRNESKLTYFCPALIRKQVLTVGQLLEDDSLLSHLAPTWRPIYHMAIQQLASSGLPSPLQHPERYPKFPTQEHWTTWICPPMTEYLSSYHRINQSRPLLSRSPPTTVR